MHSLKGERLDSLVAFKGELGEYKGKKTCTGHSKMQRYGMKKITIKKMNMGAIGQLPLSVLHHSLIL